MRFAPRGLLALAADAYGQEFVGSTLLEDDDRQPVTASVAVVPVTGPLTHHPELVVDDGLLRCFDSYESIKSRVSEALLSTAHSVVLSIDSPGGQVSGLIALVTELRDLAAKAGKPLVAHVSGQACSAAYALACAGSRIVAAPGSTVGSIGVIDAILDQTALDQKLGVSWTLLTSGARKADGNPHAPLSEGALAARQSLVDASAHSFFSLVSTARGISVEAVRGLEAGVLMAEAALEAGLIDQVSTLDQLLESLSEDSTNQQIPAPMGQTTAPDGEKAISTMKYSELVEALRSLAEGDTDEADQARKALKALEEDKEPEASDDSKEESEEKEKKDPEDDPSGDDPSISAKAMAKLESLVDRKLRAVAEASERSALLASRPDLSASALAAMASVPTAQLKDLLAAMPKAPTSSVAAARAAIGAAGTQGAHTSLTGKPEATRLSEHADILDRQMGLSADAGGPKFDGDRLILSPRKAK